MVICACGCGEGIEPLPHHRYTHPRYKPLHFQRTGESQRDRQRSTFRIPPGTLCGCECGQAIPDRHPNGKPRYGRSVDGRFYVHGHNPAAAGPANHGWKGGRYLNSGGYVILTMPGHHLADTHNHVLEHRLVWEEANGRRLEANEVVHHTNGDRADNRPENLVVMTRTEHSKEHEYWKDNTLTLEDRRVAGRKGAAARWHQS